MKAIVDQQTCVGCGLCVEICPEVFEMDGSVAKSKVEVVQKAVEATCKKAAADCPVAAITVAGA